MSFFKLSIITPVYNNLECTKNFINEIQRNTKSDYQLIIINNNSKDGTSEYLMSFKGFSNIVVQGLYLSSLCSSFIFKIFGNNVIIIDQKFTYSKPVYVEETVNITNNLRLLDKRFKIYEINFLIKVKKILTSQGKIIVKFI